jgi:hypothetical protein
VIGQKRLVTPADTANNAFRKHAAAFGRIELIREVSGKIERLRLHQESIRDKVLKVADLKHLADCSPARLSVDRLVYAL